MKRLVLKTGLSYSMKGFSCKKGIPFSIEDEKAEKLLKTGRFEEITSEQNLPEQKEPEVSADDIAAMKKDDLIAFAAEHDIDIENCKNNEERIDRIQGALGLASYAKMGLED